MISNVRDADRPTAGAATAVPSMNPKIVAMSVTDPATLNQNLEFEEAIRQTTALAENGSREAEQSALFVQTYTARPKGLTPATAKQQVTRLLTLRSCFRVRTTAEKRRRSSLRLTIRISLRAAIRES